jgi:hypothetical protein
MRRFRSGDDPADGTSSRGCLSSGPSPSCFCVHQSQREDDLLMRFIAPLAEGRAARSETIT